MSHVVARHIDDVEAFGDIGALNMEAISKALSKTRRLTSDNAPLFYSAENKRLSMYDATNLTPDAFTALGHLNPNLTTLKLDFCGPLNDAVMSSWTNSLPHLVSLELLGPFLIREAAWIAFLQAHPNMEAFLITQSPRFSLDCLAALIASSKTMLRRLRLREVGKLCDAFVEPIAEIVALEYLDLAEPAEWLTDDAVIALLSKVGTTLTHLDLSGHGALTDDVLAHGLDPYAPALTSRATLRLALNISGWKDVGEVALSGLAGARELRTLDVGWCRAMDNFVMKKVLEGCRALVEIKVWGCDRVEGNVLLSGVIKGNASKP
ncbi:hypothetical protein B0H15DRAFT_956510 [Mycena belliarum]|uniref:RNI-like protein n=1 Tax=Mycena belliarum TaxID=1033014 RepID=A0AAD6TN63_9AGAR|nr:hypothetical protein B0H15DRAFT_956991 [Mycena belliae]KAJ7075434.1 hypothetical protein B0H15DRAFT_956510 [Mycena belliae]